MEKASKARSKRLLLGVGAGIAAYKIAHVVRGLLAHDIDVVVAPTRDSFNFVGETTWASLSGNPVVKDLFSGESEDHIELARTCDAIVIAPCTADLIAQLAVGRANTPLLATVLASAAPVGIVPAMHTNMWKNPATQDNLRILSARRFAVLPPEVGALGSGDFGLGRLPEPEAIVQWILRLVGAPDGPLSGKHVMVSAGGTHEALDPVRFLGNRSTGRQGIEIALSAREAGAEVTLIAASCSVPLPSAGGGISVVQVESALDMKTAIDARLEQTDILVMAAAVADYRPATPENSKLKKSTLGDQATISLVKNPDILAEVAHSPNRPELVMGFAAETDSVLENGADKARRKGVDYLAINAVGWNQGFGEVSNTIVVVDSTGAPIAEFSGSKADLAREIVGLLVGASS